MSVWLAQSGRNCVAGKEVTDASEIYYLVEGGCLNATTGAMTGWRPGLGKQRTATATTAGPGMRDAGHGMHVLVGHLPHLRNTVALLCSAQYASWP